MKANELRIGNLVKIDCPDFEDKIQSTPNIHEKGILINNNPYSLYELEPIPLTEEILVNWCGAKEVKSKSGVMKCFELHGIKLEFSMSGNTYISQSRKLIPYLHKLQNYFFEVKDIELPINHPSAK
jgi:hypothetical protein